LEREREGDGVDNDEIGSNDEERLLQTEAVLQWYPGILIPTNLAAFQGRRLRAARAA
jgi:hypothetical protein